MKKIKLTFFLIFIFVISFTSAQTVITGSVHDANQDTPVSGVEVLEIGSDNRAITDKNGFFTLITADSVIVNLSFSKDGYEPFFGSANGKLGEEIDLGTVKLFPIIASDNQDVISLNEEELNDENDAERVSSLLTSSWDAFSRAAAFNFGVARFKVRGYNNQYGQVFLNGMPAANLDDGYIAWSIWGGLNDVMRRKQSSRSMEPTFFDFGGLGGATNISIMASDQYRQTRVSYAISNRSYRNRVMATHSTGMMKNGWGISVSASKRWAQEGYKPGSFYDAYAGFLSIDRKLGENQILNLVLLVAPNERGGATGTTKEMYELASSHYYNPYWGYQDGKKRNSRVSKSFQPIAILKHRWNIGLNTELNTSIGFQTGEYGRTRLDWYNAPDPRPDYYGYLPSYQIDEVAGNRIRGLLSKDENLRQVNWYGIYEFNKNGGNSLLKKLGHDNVEGERFSNYVLQSQHRDPKKITLNTNIQTAIGDDISLFGGVSYVNQETHHYQELVDLLGGTFYINRDKFAERDFPDDVEKLQYDLNKPDRIVRVGDDYGYNYNINTSIAQGWAKALFSFNKIDFYAAGQLSNTSFYREGKYKNGKFPENSFGKGKVHNYLNYGLKAGVTYKIDGRNYLYVNALSMNKAPYARNAYLSSRTRDQIVPDLKSENILGGEIAFEHKGPMLTLKTVGYYTSITDKTKSTSFYYDGQRTFVNYTLNGIDEVHLGTELSCEYKVTTTLSLTGVASLAQYYYNSRPTATISQDNTSEVISDRTVYMKNYRLSGTPQQAYSLGVTYRSPKYWMASLSFNYFDDIWLDFFPDRRTKAGVDGINKDVNPELWYGVLDQERLKSNYTLDFYGSKSFKIGYRKYIYLSVGVNNILNNQDFITGGYEQFRFDYEGKDVNKFAPKYFYAYGTNYFIGLTLKI